MQHRFAHLLAASSLALFAPEDPVRFDPADGLALEKTQVIEVEMTLIGVSAEVDGEPQETGDVDASMTYAQTATVRDRYVERDGARLSVFERTYVAAEANRTTSGPSDNESTETTELTGRTVRFSWDDDSEEYDTEFTEGDQDAELLEDLRAGIDFEMLLPDGEVEEGATWSVPLEHVAFVFDPFGALHLEGDDEDDEDEELDWSDLTDDAIEAAEGEFEATLVRLVTRGDDRVAEIRFVVDCEGVGSGDTTEEVEAPNGMTFELELARKATMKMQLEGTLVWDLAGHHFRSFQWTGTFELQHQETRTFDIGGETHEVVLTQDFGGSVEVKVDAEVADGE